MKSDFLVEDILIEHVTRRCQESGVDVLTSRTRQGKPQFVTLRVNDSDSEYEHLDLWVEDATCLVARRVKPLSLMTLHDFAQDHLKLNNVKWAGIPFDDPRLLEKLQRLILRFTGKMVRL